MDTQPQNVNRRAFLKLATAVPVLAATAAFLSPLLRLLKPNVRPFEALYCPTRGDLPQGEVTVAATLSEVKNPWDFKYFVFTQRYPQYTPEGLRSANVPAVVIRLPEKIKLPWDWARTIGKTLTLTETDIVIFYRI